MKNTKYRGSNLRRGCSPASSCVSWMTFRSLRGFHYRGFLTTLDQAIVVWLTFGHLVFKLLKSIDEAREMMNFERIINDRLQYSVFGKITIC